MIQIDLNDKLSNLIQQGYDRSVYGVTYGEFAALAGPELYDQIFDRVRTWQTPMYFGEAEIMLLKPLAKYCNLKSTNLPKTLFSVAGAYGIIEEIARLSSTRDLSAGISRDIVVNNPVIQQLIMMGVLDGEMTGTHPELTDQTTAVGDVPQVTVKASPKDTMSLITRALSGAPLTTNDKQKIDVVTLLNALYSMGSLSDSQDKIGTYIGDLQKTMKMGKRYPMNEAERQNYFTQLIHPIMNRLAELSDTLFQGNTRLDDTSYSTWADFMIIARWFGFYLDCVEKYDEVFPTQLIPSQSQMQVMELARAANRYKGIYLKLTQSAMTSALSWSLSLWDEMFQFFQPFMPETSAVKDLRIQVDELKNDFDKVKDPWAHSMVEETLSRMRTLSGVDVLLDRNVATIAQIPNMVHDIIAKTAGALDPIPTGADTLTHIGKYSQAYKLSAESRNAILTTMSNIASAFNSTVSAMMQATQFITRDYKLPIQESVLPDKVFAYTYPAKPMTLLPVKANFTRADDTVRTYAPWRINGSKVEWISLDKINTLIRAKELQSQMVSQSVSTVYWPPMPPIQVGEPYISIMAKQPVLATYTQNVTSDQLPARWSSWFKLWANHSPEMRPENALAMAATALAQDMVRNEGPIATCFASCCAIVHWTEGGTPKVLSPNIPWVYGIPFDDMVEANHVLDRVDTNHDPSVIWSLPGMEELTSSRESAAWYVQASSLSGQIHHFAFMLWKVAPALTDLTTPESSSLRWSLYQLVKGSYFVIPCRRGYFASRKYFDVKDPGKKLIKAGDFALMDDGEISISDTAPSYWQAVRGFCPVVLTLPHLTWDLATSCEDELVKGAELTREIYSFINIPVKYKYNDYDKSISFMASYNNPVVLLEYKDFEAEATNDKVLPSQDAPIKEGHPDLNIDDGAQAPAGVDNSAPVVSSLNPPEGVSTVDNAAQAVPIYKIETAKGGAPEPSTATPDATKNPSDKDAKGPFIIVQPATHAAMKFHPASNLDEKTISPADFREEENGDRVFRGDPTREGEAASAPSTTVDKSYERENPALHGKEPDIKGRPKKKKIQPKSDGEDQATDGND